MWQYLVLSITPFYTSIELNRFGEDRWELISIVPRPHDFLVYTFKRESMAYNVR